MKIFLSGIAGTGMSSLAGLFHQKKHEIYGSDINFYPPVDKILEKMDVKIFSSFDKKNIPEDVDFCVIGNVISRGNPEAEYILNNNIEYYSMPDALYKFFIKGRESVMIAGTHGKTTISSFMSHLLDCAGLKPGFFIGGKPENFETNYSTGSGKYFVVEGDEYETSFFDRSSKFLKYHPKYLILSPLEYDHIDFFRTEEQYLDSFKNLVNQVPSNGIIIINGDYTMNHQAVKKSFTPVVTCGKKDSDFLIKDISLKGDQYSFSLKGKSKEMKFRMSVKGRYNVWNLSSGIIMGMRLGISHKIIEDAVESFRGVERRLKTINRVKNTLFFEDFAHHPTSIKAVLKSIREMYPRRNIICCFEPRSWSLRKKFFQEKICESFVDSDELVIKDVYQKERIPENERLDVFKIKDDLIKIGKKVSILDNYDEIKELLSNINFEKNNVVIIISNGSFGNIPSFIKSIG